MNYENNDCPICYGTRVLLPEKWLCIGCGDKHEDCEICDLLFAQVKLLKQKVKVLQQQIDEDYLELQQKKKKPRCIEKAQEKRKQKGLSFHECTCPKCYCSAVSG